MKKFRTRVTEYLNSIWEELKTFLFDEGLKLSKPWAVFFWIVFIVTQIYIGLTWLEFAQYETESGKNLVAPVQLQYAYLVLLFMYSTSNHVAKYWILRSGRVINKPGGLLVFMWMVTFCVMMVCTSIWDETFIVPKDLTATFLIVVGIFFGSKGVKKFILDKISKLKPPIV